MTTSPDKSSRRTAGIELPDDSPTRIVLGDDPSQFADSHASTAELRFRTRGSSLVVTDDKTHISKRSPDEELPAIHVGPLESRKALEGETLDHFKLESFVGGGGMGAVYRAYDTRLNRIVAVKILSRDQSDSETVRRFRNEAQSAARLDHPHIARVHYVGEDKGWNFIVFEYIEGTNLRDIVENDGPLPLADALDYTLQVSEALDHASARDVVHRDIKPSNVLVTAAGAVKLVDMGLARLHQVESGAEDLTQSGVTLGTFDYISPEQARDPRLADVRSDIYSLGCTLYFMLAGRAPFPDGTALQKLIRHNSDEAPDVRLFRPEVPADIVAILQKALAKKPEQRFQSPGELILAIRRVSQRMQLNVGSSSSARMPAYWLKPNMEARPWWHRWLPLAVAAIVLLLLGLLPDSWARRSDSPYTKLLPDLPTPQPKHIAEQPKPAADDKLVNVSKPTKPPIAEIAVRDKSDQPGEGVSTPVVPATSSDKEIDTSATKVESPTESQPVSLKPSKVVVGSNIAPVDGIIVKATFAEAIAHAAAHPEVEVIELAFSGRKTVAASPAAFQIASERLEIRAAAGSQPELVFQPSPDNTSDNRRILRMTLPRSRLTISGVRLRLEVAAGSQGDWALIQFAPSSTVEFKEKAVATIVSNPAAQVAFFEPGRTLSLIDSAGDAMALPPTRIVVEQTMLRGDANVVRLEEDLPLTLQVNNSLITTGKRLLEAPGVRNAPQSSDRIQISLVSSTVVAQSGLVVSGSRFDLPYRVPVHLDQQHCVIMTDPFAPLMEYRGTEPLEVGMPIAAKGSNNHYVRSNIFFRRITRHDGLDASRDFPMLGLPSWAEELSLTPAQLAQAPTETAWHDQSPADYALKSPPDPPAGCTPALLAAVEGTPRRAIMGATNMGTMKSDMLMPVMKDPPAKTSPEPR